MRPTKRNPNNRRYFHSKPKRDKKDIAVLKKKLQNINNKKQSNKLKNKEKGNRWIN